MKNKWIMVKKSKNDNIDVFVKFISYSNKQKGIEFIFEWEGKTYQIFDNIKDVYSKTKQLGIRDSNVSFKLQ